MKTIIKNLINKLINYLKILNKRAQELEEYELNRWRKK